MRCGAVAQAVASSNRAPPMPRAKRRQVVAPVPPDPSHDPSCVHSDKTTDATSSSKDASIAPSSSGGPGGTTPSGPLNGSCSSTCRRKSGSSKYRGVSWNNRDRRWRSQLSLHGSKLYLGVFDDESVAALIYDAALLKYKYSGWPRNQLMNVGAPTNFPVSDEVLKQ